jgi:DNA-directed RNA polymerase subunit RPC12/RpoP
MSDLLSKCSVCGALLDEEDMFCANCGTEAPHQTAAATAARTATDNFQCSGCGASMSYDASAGSLRCPFCGSTQLEERTDAKILAPKAVVPFAIGRDRAETTMRHWLGQGFWRPGDLARTASVVGMQAVYVPYWVFAAETHTYWTADTSETPFGARGDWFPMTGEHRDRHSGLLVGASGALTPAETSALCPFDLGPAVAPDAVDLDNVTVEQFSVSRKYARPLARAGLEQLEAQSCDANYVPGRCRNLKVNTRIENLASDPLLLPVWIMAYRYEERVFRFLVNGQSGRATGQAPVSLRKIFAVVGIAAALIAIILLLAVAARGATSVGLPRDVGALAPLAEIRSADQTQHRVEPRQKKCIHP